MNTKLFPLLIVILSITAFSLAAAVPSSHVAGSEVALPSTAPSNSFTGNVTILPNGQISTPGSGSSPPISQSGNYYNFTGNMNGTLTIEKSGINVNGMGYVLYNNSFTNGPLVNITSVDNVYVSNLSLESSSTGAVYVNGSSHISLDRLKISVVGVGVIVSNNTFYDNVSNSIISLDSKTISNAMDIAMGISLTNFPAPAIASADNSIYNDTISIYDPAFVPVLIDSNSTDFTDSSINNSQASGHYAIVDAASYTVLKGLVINTTSYSGVYYSPFIAKLYNNTFEDNSVNLSVAGLPSGAASAVFFDSSGTISHNNLVLNANGLPSAGISIMAPQAKAMENSISVTNGSSSRSVYGIQAAGNQTVVNGNNFSESGGNTFGIYSTKGNSDSFSSNYFNLSGTNVTAIRENNTETNYTQILDNKINLNGTETLYGISLNGTHQSVVGNSIWVYSAYNFTGIFDSANTSYSPQGLNVSGNSIMMNTTAMANSETGIYLVSNQSFQSAVISGNYLWFNGNSNGESAINITNANNTLFSSNSAVYSPGTATSGYHISDFNNSTIVGNYLNGGASFASGYYLVGGDNITGYENYVTGFAGSFGFFGIGNSTFYGNTGNDSIGAVYFSNSNNVTFYHNDLTSYGQPVSASASNNIRLNLSYPIGGNYWGPLNYNDNYSGPNQKIQGSDGINDTALTLYTGYTDYYPLVKAWTNPQAVFNETGILPGASWSVTFNGVTKTSAGSQIVFEIVNGTYQDYSYKINTKVGYKGGGESGIFSYTGNNSFSYNTTFIQSHTLKITETGLPSGTTWYLVLNGTQHEVNSSSYSVNTTTITTFKYMAENTTLYYTSSGAGKATVAGTNITVTIKYQHWAYITGNFTQAGVNITINGKNIGSGNFSFNETAPAGTYHVVISGNGYITKYENFTLSPGQTENISASLSPAKSTPPPSPLGVGLYAAIGVAGVLVAIGAVFLAMRRRH